ncbi:hypothetical protein [Mycolicibacterium diernhoferi]|uniref:Peptidase C39-like domain-containing protein n=1 Tax=Mycolicibacterium diernhoferi TaxID=1801 RepID=A0A1Q4HF10_9MYCO|nr:hypothetical protein [Mycolicibacterium diernhoferi]OJZ66134.1 hypothetical protein BRW64_12170 [Mycolicibacterium diernhoferi]OPE53012.1 hypothetical protein BV510_17845 [Mycolicibacterium diernhoferi]PEG51240.1 hypothetical protein CRI78_27565 [Mycolicibacterium diernhoferi]QYL24044.1 hypothetical protein K0O62_07120 [Mycolicibacterium diernhoferi]
MVNIAVRNGLAWLAALALLSTGCSTAAPEPETSSSTVAESNWGCSGRIARPSKVKEIGPAPEPEPAVNPEPDDGVYGDPEAATRYWAEQSEGDCGLMATRMVIGELTGSAPTEREIIDLAADTPSECSPGEPVYDESIDPADGGVGHGTCTTDLLLLLDQFGIDADYTNDDVAADGGPDTGMDALLGYLNDGRQAIVCVNSRVIWDTDGDRTNCGHLITVAAVDVPNDIVYLGDSGGEDTRGEQVSMDVFEQAWSTGDHELLVTDPR